MKTIVVSKKEFTISPKTEKAIVKAKLKNKSIILVVDDEDSKHIDELDKTLNLIEQTIGKYKKPVNVVELVKQQCTCKSKKTVVVFRKISEEHKNILHNVYPCLDLIFIDLE